MNAKHMKALLVAALLSTPVRGFGRVQVLERIPLAVSGGVLYVEYRGVVEDPWSGDGIHDAWEDGERESGTSVAPPPLLLVQAGGHATLVERSDSSFILVLPESLEGAPVAPDFQVHAPPRARMMRAFVAPRAGELPTGELDLRVREFVPMRSIVAGQTVAMVRGRLDLSPRLGLDPAAVVLVGFGGGVVLWDPHRPDFELVGTFPETERLPEVVATVLANMAVPLASDLPSVPWSSSREVGGTSNTPARAPQTFGPGAGGSLFGLP